MPNPCPSLARLFVGDVDGDKDPDVLLGNHGGQNDVHVNVDTVK